MPNLVSPPGSSGLLLYPSSIPHVHSIQYFARRGIAPMTSFFTSCLSKLFFTTGTLVVDVTNLNKFSKKGSTGRVLKGSELRAGLEEGCRDRGTFQQERRSRCAARQRQSKQYDRQGG